MTSLESSRLEEIAKQCQHCGVKNDIMPIAITHNMCKKCTRMQCFQCIEESTFQYIIETNIKQAEYMLEISKEFKERNPCEYQKISEKTRQKFEQYAELLLWS